jgi:hypothetical protein
MIRALGGFRAPVAYALAAAALVLIFVGSTSWQAGGRSLPLDDPFIYLHYARQTARGEIFRYNDGDPPTQGCTSPLYALLLVPGFWLGLDDLELVPVLLLLGGTGLTASAVLAHRLAARWLGPPWGAWAGTLILLCGPLVWGCLSGMEIPALTAGLLWLLDRVDHVLDGSPPRGLLAPASAVALLRPEGYGAVLVLALVLLAARRRASASEVDSGGIESGGMQDFDRTGAGPEPLRPLLVAIGVPLVIGLVPGLLFALGGGTFTPNGIVAKSRWTAEPLFVPEALRATLESAIEITKGIFGGSLGHRTSPKLIAYDMNARAVFFAPLAFGLYLLGMAPAVAGEIRRRIPGRATLLAAWLVTGVAATAALSEPDAHFNRYQQPLMPLFLLGVLVGVARFRRGVAGGSLIAHGLAGYLTLFGLASTAVFAVHYGDNASDIRLMQMTMARVIRERLPADAVVAINDAGVLRYLSGRRTVDLVGLTTPGLARLWRMGPGSLIEELGRWPAGARPTHFAIFPNWFRLEEAGLLRPIHHVVLESVSIVDAEEVLYTADWSALEASEVPCAGVLPAGYDITDRIDIADRADEVAHAYHFWSRERDVSMPTFVIARRCAGDTMSTVADGGRVVTGGERMRVRVRPGREVAVIVRAAAAGEVRVRWDGAPVAEGKVGTRQGLGESWNEALIAQIPAALVRREEAELAIQAGTWDGAPRPLLACHYWIAQPR